MLLKWFINNFKNPLKLYPTYGLKPIGSVLFFIRCTIIFIIAIIISHTSKAQLSLGLNGGCTLNHLSTDISNRKTTNNNSKYGYCVGLQIQYNLTDVLSFQSGVSFFQKNYSFTRTGNFRGVYEVFTNNYLQIPETIKLRFFERRRIQLSFSIGTYIAYWVFAKVNGVTPNIFNNTNIIKDNGEIVQYLNLTSYSEKYQFRDIKDNRVELGLTSGISINYCLNNRYSTFIEFSYFHSLTDQQKKYELNHLSKINQTINVSLGCYINFPDK